MVLTFLVVMLPLALLIGGVVTLVQSGRAGQSLIPGLLCLIGGPVLFVLAGTLTGLSVSPMTWWELVRSFIWSGEAR